MAQHAAYPAGAYYSDSQGRLLYVLDDTHGTLVTLEDCLARFDEIGSRPPRMSHTVAWCRRNLTFRRGPA